MRIELNINVESKSFSWIFPNGAWTTKHIEIDDDSFNGGNDYEVFEIILNDLQTIFRDILKKPFNLSCEHQYRDGYDYYSINENSFTVDWGDCYENPYSANVTFHDLHEFILNVLDVFLKINVKNS